MYFLCEIQGIPCSNAPSHVFSCKYILLILLTDLHAPCTQSIMCKCSFCFGHISSWLLCKILLWHACTLAHPPVITSQSVWINLQMALGDDSILFINFFFSPSWGNCFWRLCHSPARCVSDSCRGRWVLICTNRRAWNKVLIMKCGGLEACGA